MECDVNLVRYSLSREVTRGITYCRLVSPAPVQRTHAKPTRTMCMAKTKETTEVNFVPFQEVGLLLGRAQSTCLSLAALWQACP